MKLHKISLVLICLAFTVSSMGQNSNSPEQSTSTIIVKCTQISMTKDVSFIRIYYGNNKMDKIELEKPNSMKAEENNFDKIVSTLNKLNEDGYEIVTSTELSLPGGSISTFVLKKYNVK
ncbi:MAG: hypothetical protein OEW75_02340 [Cyclobacteriaceae bacterium]|nr:hypothetical protein [Cyclobacteriaceae bacterium]